MQIIHGDALDTLRSLPDHSVDAIISDPPAGINFMNMAFDSDRGGRDAWIAWLSEIMREARRVIKPGGHALIWALPRTSHWTALALEDAGFEIRDSIQHVFGSGFPKSHDVSKAIDRIAGAEREVIGPRIRLGDKKPYPYTESDYDTMGHNYANRPGITAPATPEAQQYSGFGTALKPAHETWWLVRAPLSEPTIAANVLKWGVGGLNIDGTRVNNSGPHGSDGRTVMGGWNKYGSSHLASLPTQRTPRHDLGRFPSNFLLSHSLFCTEDQCVDDCPVLALDRQSGNRKSGGGDKHGKKPSSFMTSTNREAFLGTSIGGDDGGASRYFQTFYYCPKPSKRERNAGCDELPMKEAGVGNSRPSGDFNQTLHPERGDDYQPVTHKNTHPTVKSISLMQYLITMITPPGGIVLDCFGGSGTTAVAAIEGGFDCILIEKEQEYIDIINARVQHALKVHAGK